MGLLAPSIIVAAPCSKLPLHISVSYGPARRHSGLPSWSLVMCATLSL